MKPELIDDLRAIDEMLGKLAKEIVAEDPNRAFSALRDVDSKSSVMLSGNTEGLTYFASILIGLAINQNKGQHFHFGEGEMLDECDRGLIFKYEPAKWDKS